MQLNVKPAGETAEKWARRVAGATQDYTKGASGAGTRWHTGAAAGAQNYAAGTQEAIGKGSFGRGVDTAGPAKYQRGVAEKGAARYGPGATAATPDFTRAIGPVLDAIRAIDVPPRGPRGAEGNYARSAAIGRALRQMSSK